MRQNRPERFAREGSDPSEHRKVVAIGHSHVSRSSIYIQKVSTIDEYEAGCREHENCLGHMVETPSGLILPPQYMGLRTNIMRNEVYAAAEHAFAPPSPHHYKEYKTILTKMMAGKEGKMRNNVLSSPVDGSLRMVAIPHFEEDENGMFYCSTTGRMLPSEKVVFIPYYLQDKFKVMRVNKDTGRYVSEYVKDGDSAYFVREPALDSGSNPLVYVFYWNRTALGAHPRLMKGLRGDYDGDELHLYPVYSDAAVACCDRWQVDVHPDFEKANEIYSNTYYPDKGSGSMDFMWHTTMSFDELKNGHPSPLMCEFNRMKLDHIKLFRDRFDTSQTSKGVLQSSIDGLNSINIQQHAQPVVGDMSRIARLAASSVKQSKDGMISIMTSNGLIPMYQSVLDTDAGNSAVRAESRLCAAAQQVMLSAHRVTKSNMPSHDMVKDLVLGSEYTLIGTKIKGKCPIIDADDLKWSVAIDKIRYSLCNPLSIGTESNKLITIAYSPSILSLVPEHKRFQICRKGVEKVFIQYDVPISDVELDSLAVLYSYQVQKSRDPPTSRNGISKRSFHWVEMVMATSYYVLCNMVKYNNIAPQPVNTISSAVMSRNFDLIN